MYVRTRLNFESYLQKPDLKDATKKVEDDIAVDVAKKEEPDLPVPMELNPIDADQAVEIANNHPTEDDIDELTSYEQVLEVASDIDKNNIQAAKNDEQGNIFINIAKMPNPLDAYDSIKETEKYFNTKTNLSLSKEDIENNPEEVRNIIASELQAIQHKANNANNGTWATIKEDCNKIRTLIDKAIKFIESKQNDLAEAIHNIETGRLTSHEVELSSITEYVGNLRHFLTPYKGKGSLIELIEILKMIMIEQSPYLTSSDNKIIKDIANNESGALQKAVNYVSNAINTDPLNVKLKVKAANNPYIQDYAIYGRLTGTTGVEILTRTLEHKKLALDEKNKYPRYIINASEIDVESLKDDLILVLRNFETKFKNLFYVYIKKYEEIEKVLKPIMVENEVETVADKSELMLQALKITRFYFIELVKARVIDKLNAFIGLIELTKLAFTQKAKLNTEDIVGISGEYDVMDLARSIDAKEMVAEINTILNSVNGLSVEYDSFKTSELETEVEVDDDNRLSQMVVYKDGQYVKDSVYNLLAILHNHMVEQTMIYKQLPFGPFNKYREDGVEGELLAVNFLGKSGDDYKIGFTIKVLNEDGTTTIKQVVSKMSTMDLPTVVSIKGRETYSIVEKYKRNLKELAPVINGVLTTVMLTDRVDIPDLELRIKQIADLLRDYEKAVQFYITKTLGGK